jgi:hypothetical protein
MTAAQQRILAMKTLPKKKPAWISDEELLELVRMELRTVLALLRAKRREIQTHETH